MIIEIVTRRNTRFCLKENGINEIRLDWTGERNSFCTVFYNNRTQREIYDVVEVVYSEED